MSIWKSITSAPSCITQVTYQRLQSTLAALGGNGGNRQQAGAGLAEAVFSGRPLRFQQSSPPWKPLNPGAILCPPTIAQMRCQTCIDAGLH